MKLLKISGKQGVGKYVKVDDDVYEKMKYKELKYRVGKEDSRSDYVYFTEEKDGRYIHVRLHRYVYGETPNGVAVDHKNTDPLDCQRDNLRPATRTQNNQNRKSFKDSSSQFKGVSFDKQKNKWRCQIGMDKKLYFIGYYENAEDAAHNYDWHCIRMHQEFALLNFPDFCYDDFQPSKKELK